MFADKAQEPTRGQYYKPFIRVNYYRDQIS